jgi:hypothetical protein
MERMIRRHEASFSECEALSERNNSSTEADLYPVILYYLFRSDNDIGIRVIMYLEEQFIFDDEM